MTATLADLHKLTRHFGEPMTAMLADLCELTCHFGEPMIATLADLRKLTRHFAQFAEPMTATLADLRELTRPLSAFAAFQGHFLYAEREVASDDLRSTESAEEMDKEENDGNDKEKVNQRGSHFYYFQAGVNRPHRLLRLHRVRHSSGTRQTRGTWDRTVRPRARSRSLSSIRCRDTLDRSHRQENHNRRIGGWS